MASDPTNLGYRVTTRQVSYDQMVREQWGSDWGLRDVVYELTGGDRLDNNNTSDGIYGIPLLTGFIIEPLIYPDAYSVFTAETGQKICQD